MYNSLSKYIFIIFSILYFPACAQSFAPALDSFHSCYQQREELEGKKQEILLGLEKAVEQKLRVEDTVGAMVNLQKLTEHTLNYDGPRAIAYAEQLSLLAKGRDYSLWIEGQLSVSQVLIRMGMFHEAQQRLMQVAGQQMKPALRILYFQCMTRCTFDLADYTDLQDYKQRYRQRGHQYSDSLLYFSAPSSFVHQYEQANAFIRKKKNSEARALLCRMLDANYSDHQQAMIHASLAWLEPKSTISHLLRSATLDLKSSTNETTASTLLAWVFLDRGDYALADQFSMLAMEQARKYGAKQRQAKVAEVLPLIQQHLEVERKRKREMSILATAFFLLLSVVIGYFLFRLVKKQKLIEAHREQILVQHDELLKVNEQLKLANATKVDYVKQFFAIGAEFFDKREQLYHQIGAFLINKKYTKIEQLVFSHQSRKEKEAFFQQFDQMFLNLYPSFVPTINACLSEENQYETSMIKLPPELRLYALMRLEITDSEHLSQVLGVSKKSVYTYRNKVKGKIKLDERDFERKVQAIPCA